MKFLESESIISYDVDDTLIIWGDDFATPGEGKIAIKCPYDDAITYHKPHAKHIALLKKHKVRGKGIIVWSAGGAEWAKTVVEALDLAEHVDLVLCKPYGYVDDLPSSEWMGSRVYLEDK